VTGWKTTLTAALITLTCIIAGAAALLAAPADHAGAAGVSSLATRLSHARHRLNDARTELRDARRSYHDALLAAQAPTPGPTPAPTPSMTALPAAPDPSASPTVEPTPAASGQPASPAPATPATIAQLKARVQRDAHHVHRLKVIVRSLQRRLVFARAAAHGQWMPIISDAARRNHLSATGLYRLMKLESGGRTHAENGAFHGLFQYCWSTWRSAWNPWRGRSLYDGEAQIRATAVAIRRGWGPSMWPNTYPLAF
jgi:hypothetical protein